MAYWEKYSKHVIDLLRTLYLRSRIFKVVGSLEAEYFTTDEPVGFDKRLNYATKKIKSGEVWSNKPYAAGWFHFTGKLPENHADKKYMILLDIGGEGCLYSKNGTPIRGITDKRQYISGLFAVRGKQEIQCEELEANSAGDIDIWLDAACNNDPGYDMEESENPVKFNHAWLVEKREDIYKFFYDYSALAMTKAVISNDDKQVRTIANALNKAFFFACLGTKKGVAKGLDILANVYNSGTPLKYNAIAVGHAHLDIGFMWPIRETRRKSIRTFANQLCNIKKHSGYVFGVSQPQLVEWLESDSPSLFKEVKKAFQNGSMAPHGGMWVECDTNIPSGESLVRQCFYGKKYWRDKLGVATNVCWLPDTFGFNGNLPQILKKCGMDYFVTAKMSWSVQSKFPYHSFVWEGIDGSTVLAHLPPEEAYSGEAMPTSTVFAYDNYTEKDVSKNFLLVYGVGDGGGGPADGHIEFIKRQANMPSIPKVTMGSAYKLFKALAKEESHLPKYTGELYLQKHQGTLTTKSEIKKWNRALETKLHNLEFLNAVAYTKGFTFSQAQIDKIWKEVLLYQFHDILPGSSVTRVYKEVTERYTALSQEIDALIAKALSFLSLGKGKAFLNMSPAPQEVIFEDNGGLFKASAAPYSTAEAEPYISNAPACAGNGMLENAKFKVTLTGGVITSIIDKACDKELCKDYLGKLHIYEDLPQKFEAWDIDIDYTKKAPENPELIGSEYGSNSHGAFVINKFKYGQSTIEQTILLDDAKNYIDFKIKADWHETHKMLRAEFVPTVYSDTAKCSIQFGYINRSTNNSTPSENAQFEVCAQKYLELSSIGYNFALLSSSKYGWRAKCGMISLGLLRGTNKPAFQADHGKHEFSYAICPHSDDSNIAVVAEGYNNPMTLLDNDINIDKFVSIDTESVTIETIKVSDDGHGILLRTYENSGKSVTAKITAGFNYKFACECDCLEENRRTMDLSKELAFKPFEIRNFVYII